ncbi:Uncharacterised protein [Halioglobus japonicus]|nr:Uncharacterised protein [Halioglobus japonicus]
MGSEASPRYRAAWRWHFFAGVFVVPFLLVLAITGLIMTYYLALDAVDGERLVVNAQGHTASSPVQQMAAVEAAVKGSEVVLYMPPRDATDSAQFELRKAGVTQLVNVDPYTNEVLRVRSKDDTVYAVARAVHGSLLLGDVGDTLLEIVAGLTLLLLVTGVYMWLQQRKLNPVRTAVPRNLWRRGHLWAGLWSALGLSFFLISGLAWTNIWGGKFVQAWNAFPAEKWGPVSLSGVDHSAMNHGVVKVVPWGLEQTPMPASVADTHRHPQVNLNTVDQMAQTLGFAPRYRINLPLGDSGVYTISRNTMTGDIDEPSLERTVHIDRHSGEVLAEVSYADYPILAKSMAVGIGIHQGNMGRLNIAVNILICLALIFLCVSGTVMWWLRRPEKSRWLPMPPRTAGLPLRSGLTAVLLVTGFFAPLLGLTLLAGLLLYWLSRRLTV